MTHGLGADCSRRSLRRVFLRIPSSVTPYRDAVQSEKECFVPFPGTRLPEAVNPSSCNTSWLYVFRQSLVLDFPQRLLEHTSRQKSLHLTFIICSPEADMIGGGCRGLIGKSLSPKMSQKSSHRLAQGLVRPGETFHRYCFQILMDNSGGALWKRNCCKVVRLISFANIHDYSGRTNPEAPRN